MFNSVLAMKPPRGTRIGWVAGSDLFLDPTVSYQVAQELAGSERLPVGEQKLRQCLREHGLLASIDTGRQMLMVRRTLAGRSRQVLHLRASHVLGVEGRARSLSQPTSDALDA